MRRWEQGQEIPLEPPDADVEASGSLDSPGDSSSPGASRDLEPEGVLEWSFFTDANLQRTCFVWCCSALKLPGWSAWGPILDSATWPWPNMGAGSTGFGQPLPCKPCVAKCMDARGQCYCAAMVSWRSACKGICPATMTWPFANYGMSRAEWPATPAFCAAFTRITFWKGECHGNKPDGWCASLSKAPRSYSGCVQSGFCSASGRYTRQPCTEATRQEGCSMAIHYAYGRRWKFRYNPCPPKPWHPRRGAPRRTTGEACPRPGIPSSVATSVTLPLSLLQSR